LKPAFFETPGHILKVGAENTPSARMKAGAKNTPLQLPEDSLSPI
jgi:hypothetical protein